MHCLKVADAEPTPLDAAAEAAKSKSDLVAAEPLPTLPCTAVDGRQYGRQP